jgi:hypothetical protein
MIMNIDQLLSEISDLAQSELWHKLPALDNRIRAVFTHEADNCETGQEQQLMDKISRATTCYSNVLQLCDARQKQLQQESYKLKKSRIAAKSYAAGMAC